MSDLRDRLFELVDWLDPRGVEVAQGGALDATSTLNLVSPDVERWLEALGPLWDSGSLAVDADRLAQAAAVALTLAVRSASEATSIRSLLLGATWTRSTAELEHVSRGAAVGDGGSVASGAPTDIARWLVVPEGANPATIVVVHRASDAPRVGLWRIPPEGIEGFPRDRLVGLAGLELVDLTDLADTDALWLDDDADLGFVRATVAIGDVTDAAIDLGIALGFLIRLGEYVIDRLAGEIEADSVEESLRERLGSAYAELGVVSERLRETIASADGTNGSRPAVRSWAAAASRARARSVAVHERLLSELFEVAGASATSERYELDRPWRDFVTRQAVFPLAPAAAGGA
jgi:hypothetical protein